MIVIGLVQSGHYTNVLHTLVIIKDPRAVAHSRKIELGNRYLIQDYWLEFHCFAHTNNRVSIYLFGAK